MRVATGKAALSSEGQPHFNRRFYSLQFTSTSAYLLGRDERSGCLLIIRSSQHGLTATHYSAGMTVIVEENGDWWMADVIHVIGSVKNPKHPSFFQVADVETRVVRWIKADLVTHIVPRIHESVAA